MKLRQYLMSVGEFEATAPSTDVLFAEEQDITVDGDSSKKNIFLPFLLVCMVPLTSFDFKIT